MKLDTRHLRKVVIHALWCGFATPPTISNRLSIVRTPDGKFIATDEIHGSASAVDEKRLCDFLEAIAIRCEQPDASLFGRSDDGVEWHFAGCHTDDYPQIKIEVCFNDETIVIETESNRVQLLPWKIISSEESISFHPGISTSLAHLLPEGFLFRERLLSAESTWRAESDMRDMMQKQDTEAKTEPREELSFEENMARIDKILHAELGNMCDGESVAFERARHDYTAKQLRRLSLQELKQLKADGFDLSTSDETGQTALMLSAFPPFHLEQFQKLVAAGANVNARRADGMTGLMLAAAGHMEDSVVHWLTAGADVNLRGPGNCTALMLGARCGPIVAALLNARADVTLVDDDGDSAIDYAMQDISMMRAQSRLDAIRLLVAALNQQTPALVQRSLLNARNVAHKTRVEMSVLESLNRRPMSENVRKAKARAAEDPQQTMFLKDLDEFIDLEISEVDLADQIVSILEAAVEPQRG